jgi:uncharacterized OsmC-like protein
MNGNVAVKRKKEKWCRFVFVSGRQTSASEMPTPPRMLMKALVPCLADSVSDVLSKKRQMPVVPPKNEWISG